jgi:hypothetical protein
VKNAKIDNLSECTWANSGHKLDTNFREDKQNSGYMVFKAIFKKKLLNGMDMVFFTI